MLSANRNVTRSPDLFSWTWHHFWSKLFLGKLASKERQPQLPLFFLSAPKIRARVKLTPPTDAHSPRRVAVSLRHPAMGGASFWSTGIEGQKLKEGCCSL